MLRRCSLCKLEKDTETEFTYDPNYRRFSSRCKMCDTKVRNHRLMKMPVEERRRIWREAQKTTQQRHPERAAARVAVQKALKSGKLTRQPCEACGEDKVQAHHDDYSKPLTVRWLCHVHHRQTHYKERSVTYQPNLMKI